MDSSELVGRKLAYFVVPLPEPIGLPVGESFPFFTYETFADFLNRVEASEDRESQSPALERFVSLIVHSLDVAGDDAVVRNTAALMRLATRVLPWALTDAQRANDGPPVSESEIRQHLTVIEMACLLPQGYAGSDEEDSVLLDALDAGIEEVRLLQRAYFLAYKYPIQLLSRELLPPMIPLAVASVEPDQQLRADRTLTAMFVENSAIGAFYRDRDPVENDDAIDDSIGALLRRVPFLTYLDCLREAMVANSWRGDFRGAVIYSATAAEALLDELLLHMIWEECVTPEVAAEKFVFPNLAIQTRVKRDYESRLGGTWATTQKGPVRDWSRSVAGIRHKAIHAGYEPSREEANASLAALVALEQFVASRLADPRRLRNYPRTAIAIMGDAGLRKRGLWRGKVKAVVLDPDEPAWALLYGNWRATVERVRLQDQGMAAPPELKNALLVAVVTHHSDLKWVLWDRACGMAAEASPPKLLTEGASDSLREFREALLEERRQFAPASASTPNSWRDDAERTGDWIPAYRLVPEAACMLDRSDPGLYEK